MPREDTMIIMDNSEWMRNGDYPRSRFDSQALGIDKLASMKKQSHLENTLGLMTTAGNGVEVLVSPTTDDWRISKEARNINHMGGKGDLLKALKVAQLALNFRPMKSIQARIILFVGSPIYDMDEKEFLKLARVMTKNKIAVDIVSLGEQHANSELLGKFMKVMKEKAPAECNLVEVPAGAYVDDAISTSLRGEIGDAPMSEEDQILAQVMEQSMLEHRAQQARDGLAPDPAKAEVPPPLKKTNEMEVDNVMGEEEDEDELLQQALALSLAEGKEAEEKKKEQDKKVGEALSDNFENDLLNEAGVEVDAEMKDLKKAEKEDDKDKKGR